MIRIMFRVAAVAMGLLCAPAHASSEAADRDWSAFQAIQMERPDIDMDADPEGFAQWMNTRNARLRAAGLAFYTAHPGDPRRWDAVLILFSHLGYVPPEHASAEQRKEADELEEMRLALEASKDATPGQREQAAAESVRRALMAAYSPEFQEMALLQSRIDALAVRFPDGDSAGHLQGMYLEQLRQRDPAAARALLPRLMASTNASVRRVARGLTAIEEARTHPMDMKFTALDGREVDLAALRGKVVLIDYWATWCKPCMAEMPHVKAAYQKFRERGFEVIGVCLDEADARQKVLDAIARHGMAWPTHFDGQGWKNEYTERYAISAIPATFLLGKDGKLAATDLRGERLQTEVARLLDMPLPETP